MKTILLYAVGGAMAIAIGLTAWRLIAPAPPEAIHMGLQVFSGLEPLVLAEKKGFFRDRGLEVQIQRFTSLADSKREFRRGRIDATTMTVFDALLMAEDGGRFLIPLLVDYSAGASAIVAQPSIRQVSELRWKRVGVTAGAALHALLLAALSANGMHETDVIVISSPPDQLVRMFLAGELDAVSLTEPFLSQVREAGRDHVIYSGSEIPQMIAHVLVVQDDLDSAHPGATSALVGGYYQALEFWKTHDQEAIGIMAGTSGLSPAAFRQTLKGLVITDGPANREAFGTQETPGRLHQVVERWSRILVENGYMDPAGDFTSRLDRRWIQRTAP